MVQILRMIALTSLGLAAVGIGISIYLWFKLNIHKIWSDLTGRTEQKALEEIQSKKLDEEARQAKPIDYAERASNEELEQIWSESKVLSQTDDIRYFSEDAQDQIMSSELETELMSISQDISEQTRMPFETEALDDKSVETQITYADETEVLSAIEPESEVLLESITEKLPELSEYLGSGQTMETDNIEFEEKEPEPDLSSNSFKIIGKKIQIDTDSRII